MHAQPRMLTRRGMADAAHRRMTTKQTPNTPNKADTQKKAAPRDPNKTWDGVDEQSDESFPASDAPHSWAGRDIPPDERKKS